jgi:hypothetical protein
MKVHIVDSVYNNLKDITDVPDLSMLNTNPLYIGARKGQVVRTNKLDNFTSVGYWELEQFGYLDNKGLVRKNVFKKHDAIYITNPQRVDTKYRAAYQNLIETLKGI